MDDHNRHGAVHWTELNTRDAAKAEAFYGAVCGWSFERMPVPGGEGDYVVCKVGDEMVAGLFTMDGPEFDGLPEHWLTYFAVDDVDATARTATEAGGAVLRAPFDVPGVGRIAIIQAPGGGVSGMMTPAAPAG